MTLRFPLLAQPPASPACCAACRRPSDPVGFFDLGLDLEFWGRLYLCATDLLEMVRSAMPQLGLATAPVLETERAARRGAEKALLAANIAAADARAALSSGVLQLLHDVTTERLRLELAAAPPGEDEGETDAGTEPGTDAAGGGGAGGAGDDGGVPALEPERGPAGRRHGAAARSAAGRVRGRQVPAAEPAAGGEGRPGADAGAADGDLAGAAPGTGS